MSMLLHKAAYAMDHKEYWRSEKVAFLALCSLKGVGFSTLHKWAVAQVSFKEVLRYPARFGIERLLDHTDVDLEMVQSVTWQKGLELARKLSAMNARVIFKNEPGFPERLRNIPSAPEWIFVQGNLDNLYTPTVGVVGTRKPSDDGLFLTRILVSAMCNIPIATVSGLASGIDQLAHIESLRCHIPTVAVLGTGIFDNYPKGSELLRRGIVESGGTILTEYLPYQSYSADNFVRRNRLQAALSDFLVPIEWKVKSGTAHTVRFARSYGKKLVAVRLPYALHHTQELDYIRDECGGFDFVLPQEAERLGDIISAVIESHSECRSHIVSEPIELDVSSPDAQDSTEQTVSNDPQLPLI
ncbi:DNA-protecting protein DprA [Pseudomonas putida]|uniref:DNA-processing protein DprA n=1 Tax=Pseudomonas putida TaxID=303 RepID=UPI002D1F8F77|nr:DNA-processing protein DprA [Pseudomonas putida]MEB3900535.1 DNA-protecting protein DprA [Pseudomonas putida]